jgi:hypothetical protein
MDRHDHIWKTPLVAAQHTNTLAGDHGFNRLVDAIVIGLQDSFKTASGGTRRRTAGCGARA